MAFSRQWDENYPPDTQPANLLGQDIRNFKTDIKERVAAFGGNFADRPAVGDMITDWGRYGGNGVMYFATDTGQIFRWNGTAWTDYTTAFNATAAASLKTTGANVDVASAIPPVAGQQLTATDPTHATWQGAGVSGGNGYVDLPFGLRLQWGEETVVNTTCNVVIFPTPFSGNPYSIVATFFYNNGNNFTPISTGLYSATNFQLCNNSFVTSAIKWVAIGPR